MKAVLGIALLLSVAIAICGAHPRGGPGGRPKRPEGDGPAKNDSVTRPPKDGGKGYNREDPRFGDRRGKEPRDYTEGPREERTGEPPHRFRGKEGPKNCTHGPEDHTGRPPRRVDGERAPSDHTEGPGKPRGRPGDRPPPPPYGGKDGRRH